MKKLLHFGKDLGHILDTIKSRLFKGPYSNVFLKHFVILIDNVPKSKGWIFSIAFLWVGHGQNKKRSDYILGNI